MPGGHLQRKLFEPLEIHGALSLPETRRGQGSSAIETLPVRSAIVNSILSRATEFDTRIHRARQLIAVTGCIPIAVNAVYTEPRHGITIAVPSDVVLSTVDQYVEMYAKKESAAIESAKSARLNSHSGPCAIRSRLRDLVRTPAPGAPCPQRARRVASLRKRHHRSVGSPCYFERRALRPVDWIARAEEDPDHAIQ